MTKKLFKGLAWLFAIGLVLQAWLAGLALFHHAGYWSTHGRFAEGISVLPFLMLLISFAARLPHNIRTQTGMLAGMVLLIALSAMLPGEVGWLAAFHPVIALFLFFRTMAILRVIHEPA
ncbi:DUF6220 domain-containing protein [Paenibacillus aurantius]|uniref:DUF6220 domain-containing protein n=1 Tax=Paenibacillus aurantius TaxID=2918900 RepID=A0AA96LGK8_9BACL|nr:DUF6220 domain-containing protein [Paenibacillus aurantius]WNQ12844.1 DUF6220 domain-containing protein [Paenibacillus aurantius]